MSVQGTVLSQELKRDLQEKIAPLVEESLYDMYNRGMEQKSSDFRSRLEILSVNLDNNKMSDAGFRKFVSSILESIFEDDEL